MVHVVIPYFQREGRILSRAVRSALEQDYPGPIQILVIDDGSPVPACDELAWARGSVMPENRTLEIVRQDNAGPAHARNNGLKRAYAAGGHVALLDSDDVWRTQHIRRAIQALDLGFDFYFSNYLPINKRRPAFERDGFEPSRNGESLGDGFFRFSGDFFERIICNNVVGTSTVVFKVDAVSPLNFMPEYQFAGEDHYFWLGVARNTNRIVFSHMCEVEYDFGVNIYESGKTLGDRKTFSRIANELRFRKSLFQRYKLNPVELQCTSRIIKKLQDEFVVNAIHAIKTSPLRGIGEIVRFVRQDHASLARLFVAMRRSLANRMSARG